MVWGVGQKRKQRATFDDDKKGLVLVLVGLLMVNASLIVLEKIEAPTS